MRILVCGSRNWNDKALIHDYLTEAYATFGDDLIIIHGRCKTGADKIADDFCEQYGIACASISAKWKAQGNAAGPIRNQRLIDMFKPNKAAAFDLGGRGTADMTRRCVANEIPVRRFIGGV